jgi:hypothetical protein
MKQIDVVKANDQWVARSGGAVLVSASTKAQAVRDTATAAKRLGGPVSVRIHGLNGRIQEERSYPRGGDPRRSRG